jgi:hypothetical protein
MKERSRRGGQSTRSVNREMRGPAEVVTPAGEVDISYAVPEGSIVIFARAAFLSALLFLAIGLPAGAQGAWAAVISLVGSAGDVVGKLADGIKKAVDDGYAIGDEAHLHSLQASVLRLEYSITEMTAVQTTLVDRFNHYIQNTDHSPAAWARAKDQLVTVSERVKAVIDAVKASGPDLVRIAGPQLVADLEHNLDVKTGMLDDMRALPEPYASGEIEDLQRLVAEYEKLVDDTKRLNVELDNYVKKFRVQ